MRERSIQHCGGCEGQWLVALSPSQMARGADCLAIEPGTLEAHIQTVMTGIDAKPGHHEHSQAEYKDPPAYVSGSRSIVLISIARLVLQRGQ
jgi:hypothetical protein